MLPGRPWTVASSIARKRNSLIYDWRRRRAKTSVVKFTRIYEDEKVPIIFFNVLSSSANKVFGVYIYLVFYESSDPNFCILEKN